MSEGLPVGWTARPVGEAGEVLLGRQRSPGQMTGQHPTPYLRVANVLDGRIDFSDVLTMNFAPTERAVYGLRPGDILLNEGQSLDLVGRSAIYDGPPDTYCYQNTLVRFRPKPGLRSRYAQAVFSRWVRQRTLTQIAKQTTSIAHLGASRFAALMFPEPPEQEQQRIAEILDALDRAIRASEQVITKLEMLKRGLLHDLLTRGVDWAGPYTRYETHRRVTELRSQVGTPWPTVAIGELLQSIDAGWSPECDDEPPVSGAWGVLKVSAVSSGRYLPYESKRLPTHLKPQPELEVRAGDVLLTRANGVASLVGVCAFVERTPARLMLSDKTLRLRPDSSKVCGRMLALMLASDAVKGQISKVLSGSSGQRNISQGQVRALRVALPPLAEQLRIESAMTAHDRRIDSEMADLRKLTLLKHGLTDDLLTGRVRVSPHPR